MPNQPASNRVVVMGASAGGIEAVCAVLAGLPADFSLPILVVIHIGPGPSQLPAILSRCGPLPATHPQPDEPLRPGHVYVAPPNQHLLVEDRHIRLTHGPRENRVRPAIDPLFRSASRAYRAGAIGIILSGELDDGAAGLFSLKARGGVAMVQDPAEASVASMPRHAQEAVAVDYCLPVAQIASRLVELSQEREPMSALHPQPRSGNGQTQQNIPGEKIEGNRGTPVPLVCPDCEGPLFEIRDGELVQFHCLVGHTFSPVSLSAAHADALERAVWVTIRMLRERLTFQQLLAQKQPDGPPRSPAYIAEEVARIEQDIKLLEQVQERI